MTRVEEWTREEMGVGAAIASGSQEEKGYKALLVIKDKVISNAVNSVKENELKKKKEGEEAKRKARVTKKKQSPKRFIIRVKQPLDTELGFW